MEWCSWDLIPNETGIIPFASDNRGSTLMTNRYVWLLAALSGVAGLPQTALAAPNILLIIGDDMGVETLAAYGLGENPPVTASLDELAREGVRFDNFWAQPVCSPTRATMLTGRYGFRTGIGRPVTGGGSLPPIPARPAWAAPLEPSGMGGGRGGRGGRGGMGGDDLQSLPRDGLAAEEYTLPLAFRANEDLGYTTAAIARRSIPRHLYALMGVGVVMGILSLTYAAGREPLIYQLANVVMLLIGIWVGGGARARRA